MNMKKNKFAFYFRGKEINVADVLMVFSLVILFFCMEIEIIFLLEGGYIDLRYQDTLGIMICIGLISLITVSPYALIYYPEIPLYVPLIISFALFVISFWLYSLPNNDINNKKIKIIGIIAWCSVCGSCVFYIIMGKMSEAFVGITG